MSEQELNLRSIAQNLATSTFEPPADLWPRIAQLHVTRRQHRRRRRWLGAGAALCAGLVIVVTLARLPHRAGDDASVPDWQARAQALEIQLSAHAEPASNTNPQSLDAESELAQVDRALQSAYDRGGEKSELVPLWKQRSELLSALLAARRQSLTLTQI
jgi:hypothetical protein